MGAGWFRVWQYKVILTGLPSDRKSAELRNDGALLSQVAALPGPGDQETGRMEGKGTRSSQKSRHRDPKIHNMQQAACSSSSTKVTTIPRTRVGRSSIYPSQKHKVIRFLGTHTFIGGGDGDFLLVLLPSSAEIGRLLYIHIIAIFTVPNIVKHIVHGRSNNHAFRRVTLFRTDILRPEISKS
ncbi:uncharacterized protein LY89DRAFT_409544 [Mollisia scopiformis]|uniref:Uncharacterized protein n=1 Tax=Mollisia scopiformis TaxID=149040 RepID=A0A132B352_MOLSC|nr:uncharacterized protein LY89DRAFT_409544 [Mollisia scopiformis]KUJ06469.1 hypothetical protein LY89DRAFT_409544 [Mollisia scopiformis]